MGKRTPEELERVVATFHKSVDAGMLPLAGDAAFVAPPLDAELAWIRERSTPIADRYRRAMVLFDDAKGVMEKYVAHDAGQKDSSESIRWAVGMIRVFANLSDIGVDEVAPTVPPNDPRLKGFIKMAHGSLRMLEGGTITLRAQLSPLEDRRALAAVWNDHGVDFARLWTKDDCTQATTLVQATLDKETDPQILASLKSLVPKLASCTGTHA